MWALLVTQSAHTWGFWMLLTKIPSYIGSVFNTDIKNVSKNKSFNIFVLIFMLYVCQILYNII